MRHRYLVAYDVMDPGRLRGMRRTILGFGEPMQYSVFLCTLSARERVLLVAAVTEVMKHDEDRVMIVDLGPTGGRGDAAIQFLGRSEPLPDRDSVIL